MSAEAVKRAIEERERAREAAEQERMAPHDEDVGEGFAYWGHPHVVAVFVCCYCCCWGWLV